MNRFDESVVKDIYKIFPENFDCFEIVKSSKGYVYSVNFYSEYEDNDGCDEEGGFIYRKTYTLELQYNANQIDQSLKLNTHYRYLQGKLWEY